MQKGINPTLCLYKLYHTANGRYFCFCLLKIHYVLPVIHSVPFKKVAKKFFKLNISYIKKLYKLNKITQASHVSAFAEPRSYFQSTGNIVSALTLHSFSDYWLCNLFLCTDSILPLCPDSAHCLHWLYTLYAQTLHTMRVHCESAQTLHTVSLFWL